MSVKYHVVQRMNPLDREAPQKWYASVVSLDSVDRNNIADEIQEKSAFTKADVLGITSAEAETISKYLKLGFSVRLGDLGSFRITVRSEGTETEKEFSTKNIKKVHVNFRPSKAFEDALQTISFEKVKNEIPETPENPENP